MVMRRGIFVILLVFILYHFLYYGSKRKESFSGVQLKDIAKVPEQDIFVVRPPTEKEYMDHIKWTGTYQQYFNTGNYRLNRILDNKLKDEHFKRNCGKYGDNSYVCRGGVGPGCFIPCEKAYHPLTKF